MNKEIKQHQQKWIDTLSTTEGNPSKHGLAIKNNGEILYSPLGVMIKTYIEIGGKIAIEESIEGFITFNGHTEYLPVEVSNQFDITDEGQIKIEELNIRKNFSFNEISEYVQSNPNLFFN